MAGGNRGTSRWLVLGWAMSLALVSGGEGVIAQITPDATLGTQVNGVCNGSGGICEISGGTQRGGNLFHSFQQFSLPNGDLAGFIVAPNVQNAIVRVTGQGTRFISNINGTIATANQTNAGLQLSQPINFFLINTNGIVFGPNARLVIGGSFLATTANRMVFQDGTQFGASDPAPLLTISVPIGLQFGQSLGSIQMQGTQLSAGQSSSFRDFALVGGDVTLNNSTILTPGQRIELVGAGENGIVGLRVNGNRLSLRLTDGTPRQNITLTNGSLIGTTASNGGGEVVVAGSNIALDGSTILAGILFGDDNAATNQAGDITINAAATLQLTQGSLINNSVDPNTIGQGGNIHVTAFNIQALDGSRILANTLGKGNAGNVQVTANTITLNGTTPNGEDESGILSQVSSTGSGRSGNVTIQTDSLSITNGAVVSVTTFGNGNAGNMQIMANSIALDGTAADGQSPSGIFSQASSAISGRGGDVTVKTGSLSVTNGALISASILGNGDGGNVRVIANTIALDGTTPDVHASGIGSEVSFIGKGHGGNVIVETGSLTITNGATVSAGTFGNGDAGNVQVSANTIALDGVTQDGQGASAIGSQVGPTGYGLGGNVNIQTSSLTVSNGAIVSASTLGQGDAGNVQITANTITLDGTTPDERGGSGIGSQVSFGAIGKGGNVTLQTDSLSITNGALVNASTFGRGDAGNVQVMANTITLDGTSPDESFSSGISSEVSSRAIGKGGNVTLQTDALSITNGASVSASTFGKGDAGNVQVMANTITLDGTSPDESFSSGISSEVSSRATGKGGNVTLQTGSLSITNGAVVSASALGSGSAGNLAISTRTIRLDYGFITAEAASGNGANITLDVDDLLLMRRESTISTTAGMAQAGGNGGNITINAFRGFLVTAPNENNDITANAFMGKGGNIQINAQGIYWFTPLTRSQLRQRLDKIDSSLPLDPTFLSTNDITASSNLGVSGAVTINVLNVDPSRELVQLPARLVDASRQITQRCSRSSRRLENSFYITGNSGLPERPGDPPIPAFPTGDVQPIAVSQSASNPEVPPFSPSSSPAPIVEAQGFMQDASGNMFLVANSSNVMLALPMPSPAFCP